MRFLHLLERAESWNSSNLSWWATVYGTIAVLDVTVLCILCNNNTTPI